MFPKVNTHTPSNVYYFCVTYVRADTRTVDTSQLDGLGAEKGSVGRPYPVLGGFREEVSNLLQRGRRFQSVPGNSQDVLRMERHVVTAVDRSIPRRHRSQTRRLHLSVACSMPVGLPPVPLLLGRPNAGRCVQRSCRPGYGTPNVALFSHTHLLF